VLVSVTERDSAAAGHYDTDELPLATFGRALRDAGLKNVRWRAATSEDVHEAASTWAKRLGIPARRPAWILTARKP
jgi:hypothetical protein